VILNGSFVLANELLELDVNVVVARHVAVVH
jgi:hypothetical protein